MWQSLHKISDSNCFLPRHQVCMKWCSLVSVEPHARQSGNRSFRFHLALPLVHGHDLESVAEEGLISTGSPFMILRHSTLWTLALGSAFTSV